MILISEGEIMSTTPGGMFLPKPKSGATSIDADGKVVRVSDKRPCVKYT